MDPTEKHRLEKLEGLVAHLSMRSHLVKSAIEGSRYEASDINDTDAAVALTLLDQSQFGFLEARVARLEERQKRAADIPTADNPESTDDPERKTMSKASSPRPWAMAARKEPLLDGDEIMEIAQNSPSVSAETMGVVSSHVQAGNLSAASRALVAAQQTVAKAVNPADAMTAPPAPPTSGPDLEQVIAAIGRLERTLANVTMRLERLETRRPAPVAPPAAEQTVAKASGSKGKVTLSPEKLLAAVDAYITSPDQAGIIASMVATGDLEGAAKILATAKRAHEGEKIRQERKSWQ